MVRFKISSVLVLLICALGVSAGQAHAALEYEAKPGGKYTNNVTEVHVLNASGEKVWQIKCDEAVYTDSTTKATTLKITPSFGRCTTIEEISGKERSTKATSECKEGMQLNQPEEYQGEGPGTFSSTVTLLKGCSITFDDTPIECEIKIEGAQENLKGGYYYSIAQIKLREPNTAFEISGIKDSATKKCGLPEKGNVVFTSAVVPMFRSATANMYGANGYSPALKSVETGTGNKLVQEFKLINGGKGIVRCEAAEYTSSVAFRGPRPALLVKPVLTNCKIQEEVGGGESAARNATVSTGCEFRYADVFITNPDKYSASFQIKNGCEIKFENPAGLMCQVKLESSGPRNAASFGILSTMNRGEMEVNQGIGTLNGTGNANCPNMMGDEVLYAGTMYLPELIIG